MSIIDEARALIQRSAENVLDEEYTVREYENVEDENLAIGEAAVALLQKLVDQSPEIYIVQEDGDVIDVFRDEDEATAAYQDESYTVIEETIWEPGEYARANAPLVGDWADHKSGTLDPRPVHEVSEDGTQIKLSIGDHITPWLPAMNYTYKEAR
ncbi:hypothetical protein SEA_GRASSBOY_88 [Microbacterium phage Grassboy]|nr:hypothetical protein SEA_GRASSBOY_88 [Microbacterium phage Grassboy]